MSRVEFDELLRQRMDSEELEVDPAQWDRLSALLPPVNALPGKRGKSRKLLPWITGIAASVAALAVAAWLFTAKKGYQTDRPGLSEKSKPADNEQQYTPADTIVAPKGQQQGVKPLNNNIYAPVYQRAVQGSSTNITHNNEDKQHIADPGEFRQANSIIPSTHAKEEAVVKNGQPSFIEKEKNTADEETYTYKMPELIAGAAENKNTGDRTSIGLGGGINYGTMNTGYTLGLSARRYVSDRVFVDGTVAVLMNKNSENTLNYTGDFIADQKALASNTRARSSSENYYYPSQGLYYIQFNPSIGYKVAKRVAMSVGGDFQQMLQNSANNETLLFSDGEDARLFPTFDVGLTGKTEINVTPSIQAGVLYREGLNNLIRNETRYVNRRYVQVQVKYSLPIR